MLQEHHTMKIWLTCKLGRNGLLSVSWPSSMGPNMLVNNKIGVREVLKCPKAFKKCLLFLNCFMCQYFAHTSDVSATACTSFQLRCEGYHYFMIHRKFMKLKRKTHFNLNFHWPVKWNNELSKAGSTCQENLSFKFSLCVGISKPKNNSAS